MNLNKFTVILAILLVSILAIGAVSAETVDDSDIAAATGDDIQESVDVTDTADGLSSADAADEKIQNFVKKYKEDYGETPNQFAADAYDAVYAIAQALENAGSKPSDATDDITSALVKQFTSMSFNGLTGTNVTWSKSGEVTKDPKAVVIQNGKYVSVD